MKSQLFQINFQKGLYPDEIKAWKKGCTQANAGVATEASRFLYRIRIYFLSSVTQVSGGTTVLAEKITYNKQLLVLHLDIMPSISRPRVSNDNTYAESLFKKLKYGNVEVEKIS